MASRDACVKSICTTPTVTQAPMSCQPPLVHIRVRLLIGSVVLEDSYISSKSEMLDNFLSNQIDAYITYVQLQLHSKLANMGFEVNELNIFSLLLPCGLDYILEYLNVSLSRKGFKKTSTH
jgi:hypothetical protein